MKIVVIGGTGRVGANVVRRLGVRSHHAVPASPATGVDSITGEGLAGVMVGADVVVDVANAPVWADDAVLEFFTTSTRNLLAAERDAGVGHDRRRRPAARQRLSARQGRPGGRDRSRRRAVHDPGIGKTSFDMWLAEVVGR